MLYGVEILNGNPRDILEEVKDEIAKEQKKTYYDLLTRLIERSFDLIAMNVLQRPDQPLLDYCQQLLEYRIFRAMNSRFQTKYAISFNINWFRSKGKDYLIFKTVEEDYFLPILKSKQTKDVSFRKDQKEKMHDVWNQLSQEGEEDEISLYANFIIEFKSPKIKEENLSFRSVGERAYSLALENTFLKTYEAFKEIEGENNLMQTTETLSYMGNANFSTDVEVMTEELKNILVDINWELVTLDPKELIEETEDEA